MLTRHRLTGLAVACLLCAAFVALAAPGGPELGENAQAALVVMLLGTGLAVAGRRRAGRAVGFFAALMAAGLAGAAAAEPTASGWASAGLFAASASLLAYRVAPRRSAA